MTDQPAAWSDYYRAVAGRPPRELYRQTVARFDPAAAAGRLAVDLGCGSGIETLDLLKQGWNVVAVDQEAAAIEQLLARVPAEARGRLETRMATFETAALPAADFIWAGLSLPFCPPGSLPAVWAKIVAALKPGGRFAGDFFGNRGAWRREAPMTFLTRDELTRLCAPLHIEYFIEEEGERPTALDGIQRVHGFSVVVRKP
jgi:SAM-dependent methyltransferase